jgi:hypothetical protein
MRLGASNEIQTDHFLNISKNATCLIAVWQCILYIMDHLLFNLESCISSWRHTDHSRRPACLNKVKYIVSFIKQQKKQKQTNSMALSPRANYTDWTTATCRRNLVSTFVDRGVSRGQRGGSPTVVNLFCRPEPLLFFQVAPHLLSQGLSGPRSTPTATQKIW